MTSFFTFWPSSSTVFRAHAQVPQSAKSSRRRYNLLSSSSSRAQITTRRPQRLSSGRIDSTLTSSSSLFVSGICVFFISICTFRSVAALDEVVCGGFDMRNSPAHFLQRQEPESIERLKRCTVIEGDVRYILMTNPANVTLDDFKSVSLPNVREITGSLMVFQVVVLESLDILLPNLRIIRGNSLVFNYALVLFQNPSLKEIGLSKLTEITKGGARIAVNGELCYASTIEWALICRDEVAHIVLENNQDPNYCFGKCKNSSASCIQREPKPAMGCWNFDHCQMGCPEWCASAGLSCNFNVDPPECCHEECAGGCVGRTEKDCFACRHVHVNGSCRRSCPPDLFMIQGRRCITEEECRNRSVTDELLGEKIYFKPLPDGTCDAKCPNGYYVDSIDPHRCLKCLNPRDCVKKCAGGPITSLNDAKSYKGCNIVSGHLDISIQSGLTKNVVQQLETYLGDIREVYQYVKISFSPSFVSLSMLKSLRTIRGDHLLNGRYALSVFENQHLTQLWNFTEKLRIANGVVQFHNNPRLCYSTIMDFVSMVHLTNNITEHDVSRFSNGNKAVCEELDIELKFVVVEQEHFVLSWEEFNTSQMDHRMFLGYQLYYRQVDSENVNMFEGRDACHDSWQMQFIDPGERGVLLSEFKPHTLYAFYLTTLMVNSPGAKGGISKIYYRRTKFSYPTHPRINKVESYSASSIYLEWEPPSEPNGDVTHYMISYIPKRDILPKERNYCDEPPNYHTTIDKPLGEAGDRVNSYVWPGGIGTSPGGTAAVAPAGTCAAHQCCDCNSPSANTSSRMPDQQAVFEQKEKALFENAIHNIVFINNRCVIRHGRQVCPQRNSPTAVDDSNGGGQHAAAAGGSSSFWETNRSGPNKDDDEGKGKRQQHEQEEDVSESNTTVSPSLTNRKKRSITQYPTSPFGKPGDGQGEVTTTMTTTTGPNGTAAHPHLGLNQDAFGNPIAVVVNVTGLNFTITSLHHFTSYEIRIWACQNVSIPENFCSRQEVLKMKRTMMIEANDAINDSSIEIVNVTESGASVRTIRWDPPPDPNGLIVGYEIEYINHVSSVKKPKKDCVNVSDYERRRGHALTDLPPGNWSVRVRCLSLAQRGVWSRKIYFFIPEPYKLPSSVVIGVAFVCSLAAIAVIAFTVICIYKRNFKKKLPEYLMNVFSANPEYISQLEVYKPDEWELQRDDIELLHEIGRGSFGTVYAGIGKNIRSVCGIVFGECAVKTVSERASIYDRWHFLIEASVMKQFDTAFIVKLFGVVSEGQPALVVMEIMHKGNLKDYLRTRRPNTEENVDGLCPPTLKETLQWSGEIADGMAYLEALKFCHRDLAARNCMVTANDTCKIGDFGMARDVYVKDYYRPTGKRLMPVRWMAPEALKDATFTSKSDTWSYGVVLWEMATLASQPYAGLSNEDVMRYVVDHRRVMEMPTGCPARLYELMLQCWRYEPKDRPTFVDIVTALLPDMNDHFRRVSYYCVQRGKEPPRSSHTANHPQPASAGQPNSLDSRTSSAVNTGDGGDAIGPETPLNPHGYLEGEEVICETSLVDIAGVDSDSDLKEPVCNNNRRVGILKSHSTPSWVRKPIDASAGGTSQASSSSPTGSLSPIASAIVPSEPDYRPNNQSTSGVTNGHAALLS